MYQKSSEDNKFYVITRYVRKKCGRLYTVQLSLCRCECDLFNDAHPDVYKRYAKVMWAASKSMLKRELENLGVYWAMAQERIDLVLEGMGPDADKTLKWLQEELEVTQNNMAITKAIMAKRGIK